jgi:hypothetical protein
MPLVTEVTRKGKTVPYDWDFTVLSAMLTAAAKESCPEQEFNTGRKFSDLEDGQFVDFSWLPIYYLSWNITVLKKGRQVLKNDHTFGTGDHKIEFKAGDVLKAHRESSS